MKMIATFPDLQETRAHDFNFRTELAVFDRGECETIVRMSEGLSVDAQRVNWGDEGEYARSTDIFWIYASGENEWVFDRIAAVVRRMNSEFYNFSLDGQIAGFQLGRYSSEQGYDWHCDVGQGISRRKLSVILQLSDPADYTGGELELVRAERETAKGLREQGSVTVFPSFLLHRVARVIQGQRWSLATWLEGPPFR